MCIIIDVINDFYVRYPEASGRITWELYLKNFNDSQFDSNDDFDNKLFVFQDVEN